MPGGQCQAASTRRSVPGGQYQEGSARREVPGKKCHDSSARLAAPGEQCQAGRARRAVSGEHCLVGSARRAVPGGQFQESTAWWAVPGEQRQATSAWHSLSAAQLAVVCSPGPKDVHTDSCGHHRQQRLILRWLVHGVTLLLAEVRHVLIDKPVHKLVILKLCSLVIVKFNGIFYYLMTESNSKHLWAGICLLWKQTYSNIYHTVDCIHTISDAKFQ